jgi:hypothetical protein
MWNVQGLGFNIGANYFMVVKTIHDMAKKKILDYLSNVECSRSWIQYWRKFFLGGKTIHDMAKKIFGYLSNVECPRSWIQYWSMIWQRRSFTTCLMWNVQGSSLMKLFSHI